MIYITENKKYDSNTRETKPTTLSITKIQKLHFEVNSFYRCNILENEALFLVGTGSINFDNRVITDGNLIFIPKFSNYNFKINQQAELFEIIFDYSSPLFKSFKKPNILKASLYIQELFNQMYYNTLHSDNILGVNEGLLLNILNILYNSNFSQLSLYQKCYEWIESNSSLPITAENVADAMSCTVAHLNRIVKKASPKCLSELIADARINKIKQLIKFSNLSTITIAEKLGFGSAELLRKFFKYHTGISISEYQKHYTFK